MLLNSNSKTTVILIKWLTTNNIANNFLGCSKSLAIIKMGADFCSKSSLKSNLVKEYNTTSVPDINAEQTRSTKNTITLVKKRHLQILHLQLKP